MDVLFVHNNFPAQFQQLARFLARQPGTRVAAIGAQTSRSIKDVRLIKYALTDVDVSSSHPFARRFDLECHRAEQVLYALTNLASSGFIPDIIVAHPGCDSSKTTASSTRSFTSSLSPGCSPGQLQVIASRPSDGASDISSTFDLQWVPLGVASSYDLWQCFERRGSVIELPSSVVGYDHG